MVNVYLMARTGIHLGVRMEQAALVELLDEWSSGPAHTAKVFYGVDERDGEEYVVNLFLDDIEMIAHALMEPTGE